MKYDVIVADPPWPYESKRMVLQNGQHTEGVSDRYDVMTMDDMLELDVKSVAAKKSICFMWVTGPKLKEGIELLESWGFKYRTIAFVWNKQVPMPGYYTMSQTEMVLVGKRGAAPKRVKFNTRQIVDVVRMKHSQKPEEVQDRIEETYPNTNKLELFARRKRAGWTCLGNEIDGLDIRQALEGIGSEQ